MFSLYINSIEVALPETFDFGMVLESPMFNRRGNYSYPFNVPYEPNKSLFGHIKELSAVEPELPIDFEIKWSDVTRLAGDVSKFKYSNGEIEVILIGAKNAFYANFTNKYIDEIDMGTGDYTTYDADQVQQLWANSCKGYFYDATFPDYTQFPYTFAPFKYKLKFYSDDSLSRYKDQFMFSVINPWDPQQGNFYEPPMAGGKILVMNLYMMHVLEKLVEYAGYTINRNDLEKHGDGFFNFIGIDMRRLYFTNFIRLEPDLIAGTEFEYKNTLPHEKVTDLFDYLETWLGLSVVAKDTNKTVDLVIQKEFIRDDRIETRLNREVIFDNTERETFVPPGVELKYTIDIDEYAGNSREINPAAVSGSVNIYEDLPAANVALLGIIYRVNITSRYYRVIEDPVRPGEYIWTVTGEFAPIVVGENTEAREIKIGTFLNDVFHEQVPTGLAPPDDVLDYDLEIPYLQNINGIDYANLLQGLEEKPEFGINFLIYRGLKTYSHEDPAFPDIEYPTGSYDRYPIRGNYLDGWLSLKLIAGLNSYNYGISGNYQALPLSWEINQKRPVSFFIDIPEGTVFNFDFLLKYQFSDLSFYINKIHINFKRKKISSVRLECYYASGGAAELPQHFLLIDEENYLLIDEVHKLIID